MKKASVDEVRSEPNPLGVHEIRKPLGRVLGVENFAMNYFELDAGESFSGGLHTHHDQEEVFYVMQGTAEFETPDDTVTVEAGEGIRFAPGEFQQGSAADDTGETVKAFAFGAPGKMHDWDDLESLVYCRECETETGHWTRMNENGEFELTCRECGNSFTLG
ncbi:MAG: cupin domain-containing protein [Halobacteriales archaeon]